MSSKRLYDLLPSAVPDVDAVALGQAGLQALALAGAAILARHTSVEVRADGMAEVEGTLPLAQWGILMRALGAFADPGGSLVKTEQQRREDALVALCLQARAALERGPQSRLGRLTGVGGVDGMGGVGGVGGVS
jgi:hypothetical protein